MTQSVHPFVDETQFTHAIHDQDYGAPKSQRVTMPLGSRGVGREHRQGMYLSMDVSESSVGTSSTNEIHMIVTNTPILIKTHNNQ